MEELRIKCPSCGIILDVRNSKNEAVKRITCPNCKKQLDVTFHESPKPFQFVEMKMVQLADGSTKTIIRVLTEEHVVKVNGELLQKDDEVVLGPDDKLEIDGKSQFNPESRKATSSSSMPKPKIGTEHTPEPTHQSPTPPFQESKRHNWLLHIAIIAVIVLAFVLWQNNRSSKTEVIPHKPSADSIIAPQLSETKKQKADESKPKKDVKADKVNETKSVESSDKAIINHLSDYELEQQAMKGNAEAQCVLGKRWVNRHDSLNVVKGIKYLKLAARNGSSEAQTALRKVYAALQQSANNGSTMAGNILREQR